MSGGSHSFKLCSLRSLLLLHTRVFDRVLWTCEVHAAAHGHAQCCIATEGKRSFVPSKWALWMSSLHTHTPIKDDKLLSIRIGCKMWYLVEFSSEVTLWIIQHWNGLQNVIPSRVVFSKVTLSSPYLWVSFLRNKEFLIKSGCEMLSFSISCARFESNFSSPTGRSSENICSTTSGGLRKKDRGVNTGWKFGSPPKKKWCFSGFTYPWMLMYFFASFFFLISPRFGPNLGVLVLCFLNFTDFSHTWASYSIIILFSEKVVFKKKIWKKIKESDKIFDNRSLIQMESSTLMNWQTLVKVAKVLEKSAKSPCLWASFQPLTPLEWYP
jgi:hypothetical protein